jgi:Flp pilus assembly pilin Flp
LTTKKDHPPIQGADKETGMNLLNRMFVKAREWHKGQTMTEYALILAAVAVVVFVTYQVMGQDINSLVNNIDKSLTAT